jgi:hypothetical protein
MMKNKIMGLFMLAAMSLVGISCGNKDKDKDGKSGFTSIKITSPKEEEAVVTLAFAKGTDLADYSIKFGGEAILAGTKANSKDVKKDQALKLSELGTAVDEKLEFTVTGLEGGKKLNVSLVKGEKHEVVKDKDGKDEVKHEGTVKAKPAAPKLTAAELKEAKDGTGKKLQLTIHFSELKKDADVAKYNLTFDKGVTFGATKLKVKDLLALGTDEGKGFNWDKDAKTLKLEVTCPTDAADITPTLASSDDKDFKLATTGFSGTKVKLGD